MRAEESVDLRKMNTCSLYQGFIRWRDKLAGDVYNKAMFIELHIWCDEQWHRGHHVLSLNVGMPELIPNGSCGPIKSWFKNCGNITLSSTLGGRLNDFRLQYHNTLEKPQTVWHRGIHRMTGCASQKISILKGHVVAGAVGEDVGEEGEEDRPSNVFL